MPERPLPWLFPYVLEKNPEHNVLGHTVLRPVVEARLVGPLGDGNKVAALVDSGSTYTLAFDWMAQEVGLEPDVATETRVKIAGASRTVLFADASLRLCPPEIEGASGLPCGPAHGLEWSTTVGFVKGWADPPWLMVLGQLGFFDRFTVVMSRFAQAVAIDEQERFDTEYGLFMNEG